VDATGARIAMIIILAHGTTAMQIKHVPIAQLMKEDHATMALANVVEVFVILVVAVLFLRIQFQRTPALRMEEDVFQWRHAFLLQMQIIATIVEIILEELFAVHLAGIKQHAR